MSIDPLVTENDDLVSYLNGISHSTESDQMVNDFFETENGNNLLAPFSNKSGSPPPESKEKTPPIEQNSSFLSSFLVEFIHSIKNNLISINKLFLLSFEKSNDEEFKQYAQRGITEDIKKIDSVLNSLLNYIHINTPISKSNTVSIILEEILEANEKQIQGKKIKIFKKCEKDLPETFIHDEQVRFILNSILQYVILSIPINGTIGFLIKSFDFQNEGSDEKITSERNGGYIEVAIGFQNDKESTESSKNISTISTMQKDGTLRLILQLVKEILEKNRGSMTYGVDSKKPRTLITLMFPIERRKVIYYEPINI